MGQVLEIASSAQFNGASANVWSVEVTEWLKGDGSDRIEVLSPPSACGASTDPYLGEDPLETAARRGPSALFLVETESGWQTISPVQGIVDVTPEGEIPTEWPAGQGIGS